MSTENKVSESKVSEEVARGQLKTFMDYYELDAKLVPDSTREGFDSSCERIVHAIKMGRLEIKDADGVKVVQTLKFPPGDIPTITYGVLRGHAKVAMKGRSEKDQYGRMYAVLGSLSDLGEEAIMSLQGNDLGLAECIGMLFMQV